MFIKKNKAFSLMELMVVLAIVAILAVVAIPAYQTYVRKANRTDAFHTLLAMQLAQEKYRMTNTTYGTLAQVWGGVSSTPAGHYTLTITGNTATAYTLTATATGGQANDKEGATSCTPLVLTYANNTTTKTPAVCWQDN